jgi:hypothetical protein
MSGELTQDALALGAESMGALCDCQPERLFMMSDSWCNIAIALKMPWRSGT